MANGEKLFYEATVICRDIQSGDHEDEGLKNIDVRDVKTNIADEDLIQQLEVRALSKAYEAKRKIHYRIVPDEIVK